MPERRKGRLAIFAAIGIVALGVLVVAGADALRKPAPVDPVVTAPVPVPIQVAAPQVVVSVKATPPQAKIFVDDVPLPTNPATSTFVKDGASHRLRVEAPGFQKKVEFVTYDSNTVSIDITLDPEVIAKSSGPTWSPPKRNGSGGNATHNVDPPPTTPTPPPVVAQNDPPQATKPPPPPVTATTPTPTPAVAGPAPGTVDSRGVRATVHAHGSEVQACYDRAHMEKPDLHGRVIVGAAIGQSGEVLSASVQSTTANSSRLESCLLGAFNHWTFPIPAGGVNGNVSYTFVFE